MFWVLATAFAGAPAAPDEDARPEPLVLAPDTGPPPPSAWSSEWYGRPRANARGIRVGNRVGVQARGGAEVGIRYDHAPVSQTAKGWRRGRRDLVGRTRIRGDVLYGLTSNSLGFDVRLGSFIGPTAKFVTFQVGPDLWVNSYGRVGALDYHLPLGVGLDLAHLAIFRLSKEMSATVGLVPGWTFTPSRRVGRIGPFHEISGFAMLSLRSGGIAFDIGYQRQYNAAGVTDGIILSGRL